MTMTRSTLLLAAAIAVGLGAAPASAQTIEDLMREIAALRDEVDVLRAQVASQPPPIPPAPTANLTPPPARAGQLQPAAGHAETAPPAGDPIIVKWEPAPSISSPDGAFQMNLRGRLFVDAGWVHDDKDTETTEATEFRTARLGIEGVAWHDIKYKFEIDFADDEVDVKDAYLQWKGPVDVTIGQFKTPNSLEEQTSSRYITFMERAAFTDAFGLARQIGGGVTVSGDEYTLSAGAFRGDNSTGDEDEGYTLAARGTYGPQLGDVQAHLGGSVRYLHRGDEQSDIRYRQRPHAHLASNRYVDTGAIAESDVFYGAEGAAVYGPFAVQGEWAYLDTNLSGPAMPGMDDPAFWGAYVEASVMLTGESRAYDASKGSFQRIKVDRPVFEGGPGAVQLAFRYDHLDLSDEGIFGGEQSSYIAGVNWWLNRHTRLMFNYAYTDIENATAVSFNDPDGENGVHAFMMRAQIDW